ncbi:hypothetical protein DL96DRAFT_1600163 [Flagelloscypha sp. PMI_526]|nr:hypothetical protein DL96DRAFT_1600163 [Flagelloscypha sp. PMI_526]
MDCTKPFPQMPFDIEPLIFYHAARVDIRTTLALTSVSKEVQNIADQSLFANLTVRTLSEMVETTSMLKYMLSRGPSKRMLRARVYINTISSLYTLGKVVLHKLLVFCPNFCSITTASISVRLYVPYEDFWSFQKDNPLLKRLKAKPFPHFRRLVVEKDFLFGGISSTYNDIAISQPFFRHLTHIAMGSTLGNIWFALEKFATLSALTHLCIWFLTVSSEREISRLLGQVPEGIRLFLFSFGIKLEDRSRPAMLSEPLLQALQHGTFNKHAVCMTGQDNCLPLQPCLDGYLILERDARIQDWIEDAWKLGEEIVFSRFSSGHI